MFEVNLNRKVSLWNLYHETGLWKQNQQKHLKKWEIENRGVREGLFSAATQSTVVTYK